MTGVTSVFLEQGIEGFFHIVLRGTGTAALRVERYAVVGLKEIAEIRSIFIRDVISLRFRALIAFAGIKKTTIFAAVSIGLAMRAFIFAPNSAYNFDFSSAAMTNHTAKDNKFIRYESNH